MAVWVQEDLRGRAKALWGAHSRLHAGAREERGRWRKREGQDRGPHGLSSEGLGLRGLQGELSSTSGKPGTAGTGDPDEAVNALTRS